MFYRKLAITFLVLVPVFAIAGISRNNTVDWVALSTDSNSGEHFIQFVNDLANTTDCKEASSANPRIRLSKADGDILSLLLAAKVSGKNVGFYYKTSTSITATAGHGLSTCEFTNVWLETD